MKSVLAGAEELTLKELIIMEIKIGSSAILDLWDFNLSLSLSHIIAGKGRGIVNL